jgi:hypothetical protein
MTDELRKLAEALIDPKWERGHPLPGKDTADHFIAAASPAAVLALLDRIEELEAEKEDLLKLIDLYVCPECGMSLLSDHDLDCPYWGRPVGDTGRFTKVKAERDEAVKDLKLAQWRFECIGTGEHDGTARTYAAAIAQETRRWK